ncbi:hypothetical protein [Qipengyuania qiaonensis]|uniref:DUF2934 domain-containing protein n=1 Tax=Qipengyuania qiaonensis TaxID=2867240 RepID=A0ABS7JAR5_9SPHN|nr:hypothetical protein [Qipengyuania qiaonensis]MBX7482954.1 hypothetical protein [Qipengyuania qiaonensis]
MTLDQLIRNHELAKANVARPSSAEERETYFDLVAYYAKRIRAAQSRAGRHMTDWYDDEHPRGSDR